MLKHYVDSQRTCYGHDDDSTTFTFSDIGRDTAPVSQRSCGSDIGPGSYEISTPCLGELLTQNSFGAEFRIPPQYPLKVARLKL